MKLSLLSLLLLALYGSRVRVCTSDLEYHVNHQYNRILLVILCAVCSCIIRFIHRVRINTRIALHGDSAPAYGEIILSDPAFGTYNFYPPKT